MVGFHMILLEEHFENFYVSMEGGKVDRAERGGR